jgi:hypothetical protein
VAGGTGNNALGLGATVAGGVVNLVSNSYSTVSGGYLNIASGQGDTVAGGYGNATSNSYYSAVSGGYQNVATNQFTTVGGGQQNSAFGLWSTVGGGQVNKALGDESTVAGGTANTASNFSCAIGGGIGNIAAGPVSTVAGGYYNTNNSDSGTIGGGEYNSTAYAGGSTIAGGANNTIQTNAGSSTIAGGAYNTIQTNAASATIGGGGGNTIGTNSGLATIPGGYLNQILSNSTYSTIGGGYNNTAAGTASTVPGGYQNTASAPYSFSAGYNAMATNAGSFVWSDPSSGPQFTSTTTNQFNVRAVGGVRFVTAGAGMTVDGVGVPSSTVVANATNITSGTLADARLSTNVARLNASQTFTGQNTFSGTVVANTIAPASTLTVAGDILMSGGAAYHNLSLSGGNSTGFLYGSYNPPANLGDGIHLGYNWYADAGGNGHVINGGGATSRITAGYGEIILAVGDVNLAPMTTMLHVTTAGVCVQGTVGNCSDRNVKQDVAPVSPAQILDKVLELPVSEWSYKFDAATRHIGPMAQDFYSAFNVGQDEKHITSIDEGGVALAAIQGLNQKVDEKDAKIRDQESRIQSQSAELAELKQRLAALENIIRNQTPNNRTP